MLQHFYPRSHEGNDCYLCARLNGDYRFNLRSHEGNDSHLLRRPERPCVSIHVPTRGTTETDPSKIKELAVSIHVPTRGTTCFNLYGICAHEFQSTFPRGERPDAPFIADKLSIVSIHGPTRGTTGHIRQNAVD